MLAVKLFLLAALSLVIVTSCLPNIEASRQEVRSLQAFNLAHEIKAGNLPIDTIDPWGNAFDIDQSSPGDTTVTSLGPNMSTPLYGYDDDDVSTSMQTPPHEKIRNRKQKQFIATFGLAFSPWLVALIVLIRGRMHAYKKPKK